MAYIKNVDVNNVDRMIVDVGVTISQGEWAEVPDEVAIGLAQQPVWEYVDENGKALPLPEVENAEEDQPGETVPSDDVQQDSETPKPKASKAKNTKTEETK